MLQQANGQTDNTSVPSTGEHTSKSPLVWLPWMMPKH